MGNLIWGTRCVLGDGTFRGIRKERKGIMHEEEARNIKRRRSRKKRDNSAGYMGHLAEEGWNTTAEKRKRMHSGEDEDN